MSRNEGRQPTRLTREQHQQAFLTAFALRGNVTFAADAAEVSRTRHYEWLAGDETYPLRFEAAKREFADLLVDRAREFALEGVERYVVAGGKLVLGEDGKPLKEREMATQLHLALLKAKLPDEFRERQQVEHTGPGGGPVKSEVKADVSPEFVAAVLGHLHQAGHADPAPDPAEPLDSGRPEAPEQ